jgi:hypothetical protein
MSDSKIVGFIIVGAIVLPGGGAWLDITATRDATTLPFSGVTPISALGTANDDLLQINGAVAPALSFNNAGGHDSLHLLSGT